MNDTVMLGKIGDEESNENEAGKRRGMEISLD